MFGSEYVKRVAVLVNKEYIFVCEDCLVEYLEENGYISSSVRRAIDGQNDDMNESAGWGEVRFVTAGSEKLTEICRCNEDEYSEGGLFCDLCGGEIFEMQVEEDEDEEDEDDGEEVDLADEAEEEFRTIVQEDGNNSFLVDHI